MPLNCATRRRRPWHAADWLTPPGCTCWPTRSSNATTEHLPMNSYLLPSIHSPADVRRLSRGELKQLAIELRDFVLQSVSQTGGHLSSNLGTLDLTVSLHHVF